MIVDLSHVFHDGMPGVRFKSETGEMVELTAHIRPYMTHAQSCQHYDGKASFEIFRFFSIPLKARDAAAFPVRAFAEVRE